jgi:hypothetical protein
MTLDEVREFLKTRPEDDHLAITAMRHLEDLEFVLAELKEKHGG